MKTIPEKLKFENKQYLVSTFFLVGTLFFTTTLVEIILIVLVFFLLFVIAGRNYLRYCHSVTITEEKLSKLKAFGREDDGSFSDRAEFSIVPFINSEGIAVDWYLTTFDEVDGSRHIIKRLRSLNELKRIYEILTDKELE
jgi:hypothetical protein